MMQLQTISTTNGKFNWWEIDALDWLTQVNLAIIEMEGKTSLPMLYDVLCRMQGDLEWWASFVAEMEHSRFPEVRRFAGQIRELQKQGREGFTSPYSALMTSFAFMQDPRMSDALSGNDFSMCDVCDAKKKSRSC